MSTQSTGQPEYEYVVVGSGAGGGPLAANLAKAGRRVLLLEAGAAAEPLNYRVPVFHALSTEDDSLSWDFFVRHYADDGQQRRDAKFTEEENGVLYPRAGTLGGCTAHNAMVMIYPHNSDWDELAELTGDPSWGSDNMRKYFERLERCRYRPIQRFLQKIFRWNPARHGFDGWLGTTIADPKLVLRDKKLLKVLTNSTLEALGELGTSWRRVIRAIRAHFDPNDWRLVRNSAEGIRVAPISTFEGRRNGTREYIRQVQSEFPENLTLRTNCLVTKVLFDDDNRAVGVEYLEGARLYRADAKPVESANAGVPRTASISREVILAGGAFNTPQLLKLSGVGPREELEKHGIEVRVDLPGVGENLQDRYEVGIVNRMKENFSLLRGDLRESGPDFREWQNGKGPYTTNGAVIAIIKRSNGAKPEPDLFIFAFPNRFQGYFPGYSDPIRHERDYFTWVILKAHTRNKAGTVTLRSTDPRDAPDINFRYFEEGSDTGGEDLDSVVDGVEFVRQLTASVSDRIDEEETPGADVRTREQIRDFVRNQAWGHHASCTCKIGPRSDEMAVLDSNFRVYGTENLRVVDASVFPRIPGFFIVSSVYMISEKASDVILADADQRDDIDRIVRLLKGKLAKDYQNTTSLRDTHPKSNGLVRGEFVVEPGLPEDLRVGLFKEPRTYNAWIRFENAVDTVTPDYEKDFRGLAMKLFDVEGEKLLDDEKFTHDFLFIAHDVFSIANPREFGDLFESIIYEGSPNPFFLRRPRNLLNIKLGRKRFANPLEINWYSVAPFLFGTRTVKYALRTSEGTSKRPRNPSDDYLREAMRTQLESRGASMDFMIQFRTDPKKMPIENTLIRWKEKDSPFIKVATINIPPQSFNSREQREFDENLSFNPWHCLPEHRPLGGVNLARREVMKALSDFRLERNKITRVEPTGDERF